MESIEHLVLEFRGKNYILVVTEFRFKNPRITVLFFPSDNYRASNEIRSNLPYDNRLKHPIISKINELPSIYDAVKPLPESDISASRRAELMGLPAVKCRWTEYSLAKCNNEDEEVGGSYHQLKNGDMVWQTTKGHCFGPDKGDGLYQPFYFTDSDVFRNPLTMERLPQDCFARARKEDDPDFPGGRNVRQRT